MEKKNKILIVDDEPAVCNMLKKFLTKKGYKASIALSGEEALKKIKRERPKIALLDIRMPDMDGIQTLKEVKKLRPETMVIMMTAYSMDEMVHKALEEKASDIIYKPFEIAKVLSLIKDTV